MLEKRLKRLNELQYQGGITTYILLLFGMGFMMYMFGFESFMSGYFTNATVNGTAITSPNLFYTNNPIGSLLSILQSNQGLFFAGGTIAAIFTVVASRLILGESTASTIVSYLIPIGFLIVFLNLFVFPVATMQADLQSFDIAGLPATMALFSFFNLFLILAIIDFVRGGQT
jgi:hypothetical protein